MDNKQLVNPKEERKHILWPLLIILAFIILCLCLFEKDLTTWAIISTGAVINYILGKFLGNFQHAENKLWAAFIIGVAMLLICYVFNERQTIKSTLACVKHEELYNLFKENHSFSQKPGLLNLSKLNHDNALQWLVDQEKALIDEFIRQNCQKNHLGDTNDCKDRGIVYMRFIQNIWKKPMLVLSKNQRNAMNLAKYSIKSLPMVLAMN